MADKPAKNNTSEPEAEQDDNITLSAALLAPLNAIFEAQVHAARAFLSFVLQMGFRYQYTDKEKKELRKEPAKNKEILDEIEAEETAKKRINELEIKDTLTSQETKELWALKAQWDEMRMQKFDYFDDKGNATSVFIPNLAILPIKPLGVENANFKFELNVKTFTEDYNQMGSVKGAAHDRPWFLIKPKRIKGEFGKSDSNERSIKIEVNVSTTDMPYGLDKLLTSLTSNVNVIPKT
jgi:hypothetical protein